jgi:hypothetical protein
MGVKLGLSLIQRSLCVQSVCVNGVLRRILKHKEIRSNRRHPDGEELYNLYSSLNAVGMNE